MKKKNGFMYVYSDLCKNLKSSGYTLSAANAKEKCFGSESSHDPPRLLTNELRRIG